MRSLRVALFCVAPLAAFVTDAARGAETAAGCTYGGYRSPVGDVAAITQPLPGRTAPRYTLLNGKRGDTDAADSPMRCSGGVFVGRDASGAAFVWKPIAFRATPTTFESEGATLYGLLLEPPDVVKPPLVVFVHGSEKASDIGIYYEPMLTAQGVSTFFYDKRGTGKSTGTYTQDFILLAKDAANAAAAARKLAAGRFGRIGFFGGSQGGWVAPLAAADSKVDFLEVGFGVVGTALEQDQWQVDYQLAQDGFGPGILPDVHRVTDVTASVVGSDFANSGQLAAIAKEYSGQPWYSKIDGQYSGDLLKGNVASVRRDSESLRIPWHYTGFDVLRQLEIPQLWVFAKDDSVAPSAKSIQRLQSFSGNAAHRSIVVFPNTDHGITTFHVDATGARKSDGLADGYLRLLADFAKGKLSGTYGAADWVTTAVH
jgi:pimeloyl-ACP methyl ester carboxylesterase